MPTVLAKVDLPENEFVFYQPPKVGKEANPGRRLKGGSEFQLYYDENYPIEDVVKDGKVIKKGQKGKNITLLGQPKGKPGPRKKAEVDGDNVILDA